MKQWGPGVPKACRVGFGVVGSVNYYDVLGVSRDADQVVIAAAYRALARKYHPDTGSDTADSEKFGRITMAFEVLRDPEQRRSYDEQLSSAIHEDAEWAEDTRDFVQPPASAMQWQEIAPKRTVTVGSVTSDVLWLVLGVPVCFVLGVGFAHILLSSAVFIFFDWMTADSYSFSQAAHTVVELIQAFVTTIQEEDERVPPQTLWFTAFSAGWLYLCAGAAASAIVSHTVEERPWLPIWPVFLPMIALALYSGYRALTIPALPGDGMATVNGLTSALAILAGVVSARTSLPQERMTAASA